MACLYHVRNTCGLEGEFLGYSGQPIGGMDRSLELIQASQESEDWPCLAAHLEDDLLPALAGFEDLIENMSDRI